MARVPDTPCAGGCGKLLFVGKGSLPQPTCQACRARRRAAAGLPPRQRWSPGPVRPATCHCGKTFETSHKGRRYCSKACSRRRPTKQVPISGTCEWCGQGWTRSRSQKVRSQRYCSPKCRGLALSTGRAEPIPWLQCDQCAGWFVARRGAKRCSEQCRADAARTAQQRWVDKRDNSERIMRLYRMAVRELDIPRASMWRRTLTDYLARRDGDRCGICNQWVDLDLPSGPRGNPDGPSIDHVVPVSHGGTDDLANLRLTHWACNNKRGNRGGNEQLRLIA